MTIHELIVGLQEFLVDKGNLPVWLDDPDTGWLLAISVEYQSREVHHSGAVIPAHLAITSSYVEGSQQQADEARAALEQEKL
jgi:hypothetical protein